MGMFDSIIDHTLRCPYCGRGGHVEIQTKSLDCQMATYHTRTTPSKRMTPKQKKLSRWIDSLVERQPEIPADIREVEAYASCSSPLCTYIARLIQVPRDGYYSGFGRGFQVIYKVAKGRIVAPAVRVDLDEPTLVGGAAALKKQFLRKMSADPHWRSVLAECAGDFGIAVLMYNAPLPGRRPSRKGPQRKKTTTMRSAA
jgi:hypothetical protein